MSGPVVRCLVAVLFLAMACGGRVLSDGADTTAGVAGSTSAGVAGSTNDGVALGGTSTANAGGTQGGGGTVGDSGGTDSGGVVDCPQPSSFNHFSSIGGKKCSSAGALCSLGNCTFDCSCEATGDSLRWNCVALGCPPK